MVLNKNEIRTINKNKRNRMDKLEVEKKSIAAAEVFLASDIYKNAKTIMLYMPLGNEMDTGAIIKAAFDDKKKVVLPVTDVNTGEITPYYVTENSEFVKGAFGVTEPFKGTFADKGQIDVILLPGIAFDRLGNRVGFGKGCYDKFLEDTKVIKVGYCYQFQVETEIEAEIYDIKMDFLITESGIIRYPSAK